jgi:hypothetical protein
MTGNYKQFMAYLTSGDILRLKKAAKKAKTPMAQIIREAIQARLSGNNPYTAGFNDGLEKAVATVASIQAAQMRFPSGKSFAELVEEEVLKNIIQEVADEADGTEKPVSGV